MRVAKDDVDVKMEIPGAVIRQRTEFGDASGFGKISGEYFTLVGGRRHDAAVPGARGQPLPVPALGLRAARPASPRPTPSGAQETVNANDLFYWPPGHNVKVDADAEIVMFSPQHEHSHVIDHMIGEGEGPEPGPGHVAASTRRGRRPIMTSDAPDQAAPDRGRPGHASRARLQQPRHAGAAGPTGVAQGLLLPPLQGQGGLRAHGDRHLYRRGPQGAGHVPRRREHAAARAHPPLLRDSCRRSIARMATWAA